MKARIIAILTVLAIVCTLCWWLHHSGYQQGYDAATERAIQLINDQIKKQQQVAHQASKDYQIHKLDREEKAKVQYVEVPKIIKEPVYVNNCINDNGRLLINQAIVNR